jgi:hypothetical protein
MAALILVGCNQLLGVDPTHHVDAAIDAYVDLDEDKDNIRNDIDNCPGIYNPNQADRDGDGVGDVCDPHPDTAGDKIAATAFFSVDFGDWTPDAFSNWSVHDGALYSTPSSDGVTVLVSTQVAAPRATIEIGFSVIDYGTAPDYNQFELELAYPGDPLTCQIGATGPTDPIDIIVVHSGTGVPQGVPNVAPGAVNRVTFTRDPAPGNDTCTLNATSATLAEGSPLASGQLTASFSTTEQLALQYIVIYAVP